MKTGDENKPIFRIIRPIIKWNKKRFYLMNGIYNQKRIEPTYNYSMDIWFDMLANSPELSFSKTVHSNLPSWI